MSNFFLFLVVVSYYNNRNGDDISDGNDSPDVMTVMLTTRILNCIY